MRRLALLAVLVGGITLVVGATRQGPERAPKFPDPVVASRWFEGTGTGDGATRDYYNREAGLRWSHYMGDWCDRDDRPQGAEPFVSVDVGTGRGEVKWDITGLARAWQSGRYANQGLVLRGMAGGGIVNFYGREQADPTQRPRLVVVTATGRRSLPSVADTYLDPSTFKAFGSRPRLQVSTEYPTYIRFDLSGLGPIQEATLYLTSYKVYGRGQRIGIFRACEGEVADRARIFQGIAARYQGDRGLEDDPHVVFFADFDDWWWFWQGWSYGALARTLKAIRDDPKHEFRPLDGKALRVEIPKGSTTGMNMGFVFRDEGLTEPEAIYFRYYLRFANDWQTTSRGKLPGISGTYNRAGWGGRRSDGYNGWSARGAYWNVLSPSNPLAGRIPIGNYVYHADMEDYYGDQRLWTRHHLGYLVRNRWYCLEQYLRLNTPGKKDGVIMAWVDGRLAARYEAINFRKTPDLKIEKIWMNVYHGGTHPVDRDIHLYIDNVVVATSYIGPMNAIDPLGDARE